MIKRLTSLVLALGVSAFISAAAFAQPDKQGLSGDDKDFMMEAAKGGMAEVALSQLAVEKSTNADVKKFAEQMVADHTKANTELKALAASKTVTLPADMGKHQKVHDKLAKLQGADFDKAYVEAMLDDHEHDVKAFEKQAARGQDQDVKKWAAQTLPTLQHHLKMVQDLDKMHHDDGHKHDK